MVGGGGLTRLEVDSLQALPIFEKGLCPCSMQTNGSFRPYSSGPGEASKLKFLLGEVLKGGLLQEHGLGPRAKVTEI